MLVKSAESLVSCGKVKDGEERYRVAVSVLVPDRYNDFKVFRGGDKAAEEDFSQLGGKGAFTGDHLWRISKYFLGNHNLEDSLYSLGAVARFRLDDGCSTRALYECFLAVTTVQLCLGDVVAADRTYMDVHLQVTSYLYTDFCKLAEEAIMAVKNMDTESLSRAKSDPLLNRVECSISDIFQKIQISGRAAGQASKVKKDVKVEDDDADKLAEEMERLTAEIDLDGDGGIGVGGGDGDGNGAEDVDGEDEDEHDNDDDDDELDLR